MASKDPDAPAQNATVIPIGGQKPASGIPARGYTWPPFEANNTAALKHGARSERMITPLAAKIGNELLEQHTRLRDPLYREAVLEYARVLAQVELLQTYVDQHGMWGEDGKTTGAADYLLRVRKHASNLADRLGLTPLANARLGKDTSDTQVNIAKLIADIAQQENAT
ncbi:hypothetical protein [Gordonia sp. SL306]|uniref:hypothetical protein n=1 Tax=Gordonia sp. SL306 TaxID=2995145 RepID=UPI00227006FD|nr:hypothetical protein [Gordonia sp. SL306]WAC54262.1 hypothetical protein OVA31_16415 [Gordonia sp. SL306]